MEDYELRNECELENVLNFLTNHKVIINCEICICQIFSGNKGWLDNELCKDCIFSPQRSQRTQSFCFFCFSLIPVYSVSGHSRS